MVEVINSSFIPKNEFKKQKTKRSGPGLNIFFLISLIIFLSVIVASVGVYLYESELNKTNEQLLVELDKSKGEWGLDSIREFSRIGKKIEFSRTLLKQHYDILPIFSYLEERTLQDVVLKDISLTENSDYILVTASGSAPALTDLQLQSRSYVENKNLTDLVMSDITKSREGESMFKLSFSVNKKFLTERTF